MNSITCMRRDLVYKLEFIKEFNVVIPFGISMQILANS